MYTMKIRNGISISAASMLGKREQQQDFYVSRQLPDRTIAIVCDGMGGLNGGSVASRHAAEILLHDMENISPEADMHEFFRMELEKLDDEIYGLKNPDGSRMGAGTTIVSVLLFDNYLYWFSVGDSKLFYYRKQEMYCVTREHNYAMKLNALREEKQISEEEYKSEVLKGEQLISYLGMGMAELFDGNYSPFLVEKGDKILLCTDGLYRSVSQQEIKNILQLPETTEKLCMRLEKTVNSKNVRNQDNATWIILQRIGEGI